MRLCKLLIVESSDFFGLQALGDKIGWSPDINGNIKKTSLYIPRHLYIVFLNYTCLYNILVITYITLYPF